MLATVTRNLLLTVVVTLVTSLASFASTTIRVSVNKTICPEATFTSIQSAINQASAGDTIEICPGIYEEQLFVSGPRSGLTIRGIRVGDSDRIVVKPHGITVEPGFLNAAAILINEVNDVTIENISVDASNNRFPQSICNLNLPNSIGLNGIFFRAATGTVRNSAVYNVVIDNPACVDNGNGVGGFGLGKGQLVVEKTSIHNFASGGVIIQSGLKAIVRGNIISGRPPIVGTTGSGGITILGPNGEVTDNEITMGACSLGTEDCRSNPDFGVYLLTADNTIVRNNVIIQAQNGVLVDSTNGAHISANFISDIDTLDGVDFFTTVGTSTGNEIVENVFTNMSLKTRSAAVRASQESNTITGNQINDAYVGISFLAGNTVVNNTFYNTNITTQLIP